MPRFLRITPNEGHLVRDPFTKQRIPEEGARVAFSSHWVRQAQRGAITLELDPEPATLDERAQARVASESTNEDEADEASAEE